MIKLTKHCAYCNKVFEKKVSTSLYDWNNQTKYCSYPCYWKDKKRQPMKICPQCGITFMPKDFRKAAIFCSTKCRDDSQRKPYPLCELCGETCKKHSARFCSPECKILWYRGKAVYNFVENPKSSITPVDYAYWKNLAEEIRQRDKVCQHCGKTPEENGRALDVHHKIPYRISHIDSPDNLVALCRSCHKTADYEWQYHND